MYQNTLNAAHIQPYYQFGGRYIPCLQFKPKSIFQAIKPVTPSFIQTRAIIVFYISFLGLPTGFFFSPVRISPAKIAACS